MQKKKQFLNSKVWCKEGRIHKVREKQNSVLPIYLQTENISVFSNRYVWQNSANLDQAQRGAV